MGVREEVSLPFMWVVAARPETTAIMTASVSIDYILAKVRKKRVQIVTRILIDQVWKLQVVMHPADYTFRNRNGKDVTRTDD